MKELKKVLTEEEMLEAIKKSALRTCIPRTSEQRNTSWETYSPVRAAFQLCFKDVGADMSVENAMRTLERLKAVHIIVGKGDEIEVHRKLSGLNCETRMLVEKIR